MHRISLQPGVRVHRKIGRVIVGLGVFLSFLVALAGPLALTSSRAGAQTVTYRTVSKRCGRCGHLVSARSQAGGRCPYCGAYWSYESTRTVRHGHKGHTGHRTINKTSRVARRLHAHKRARRNTYFRPQPVFLAQPIQQVEYVPPQTIQIARPQYTPVPASISAPQYENANDAIGRIRSQPYSPLPTPSSQAVVGAEQGGLRIQNQTAYTLYVHYSGPITRTITLQAGQSTEVIVPEGEYEVAGEVSNKNVRPFYGRHTYNTNMRYQQSFYIVTR